MCDEACDRVVDCFLKAAVEDADELEHERLCKALAIADALGCFALPRRLCSLSNNECIDGEASYEKKLQ